MVAVEIELLVAVSCSSSLVVFSAASCCFSPSRPSMENAGGICETAAVVVATAALAVDFFESSLDPDIFRFYFST